MPNASVVKLTYAELEERCEQYRMMAEINRCTVIAQQVEYNRYISKLEKQLFDAVGQLKKRRTSR